MPQIHVHSNLGYRENCNCPLTILPSLSSISNVGGSIGFNYLFGFGINAPSTLAVSFAFSLLLIPYDNIQ